MYEQFFGLRERPFGLTPDPRYLLLTAMHAEALSTLQYGISSRAGVVLVTGEAGTGKTTVLRAALTSHTGPHCFVTINNPILSRGEFVEYLAREFGLSDAAAQSKARLLVDLRALLERHYESGVFTTLVIDEAHSLSDELLEEVRLLANIETDTAKLLTVVLTAQPELAERLNAPYLRQLKQRIALRCSLRPLQLRETAAYIVGRVRVAGGQAERLFTLNAVQAIHEFSGGIPRVISVICDNLLIAGFALNRCPVTRNLVLEVCRDLDLQQAKIGAATVGAEPFDKTQGRLAQPATAPAGHAGGADGGAELAQPDSAQHETAAEERGLMFGYVTGRRRSLFF